MRKLRLPLGGGVQSLLRAGQQHLRIELYQPRVIAQEAAREHRTGQALVIAGFHCLHLPWRELELARNFGDAEPAALARSRELPPEPYRRRFDIHRGNRVAHSYWPAIKARASRESGKFLRNWKPRLASALRSPRPRSSRSLSHSNSA